MNNTSGTSNNSNIREQYKNTGNLKLRKSLHEKYSVNKVGFQRWMFHQYPFRPKMKILELGSGRGELWNYYLENNALRNYEMDITISDFSDGMVDCLQHVFSGCEISVRKIDIQQIPFDDASYDLIIANAMLYHVQDIDSALSEVKRVLKKDGLFYCSTLGLNGMTGYLDHALQELGIPFHPGSNLSFTLQNGGELLKKQFGKVERRDYVDALEIDNIRDYVAYIYSLASMQELAPDKYDVLVNYFSSRKVNGYLHIPKEYGMFVACKC